MVKWSICLVDTSLDIVHYFAPDTYGNSISKSNPRHEIVNFLFEEKFATREEILRYKEYLKIEKGSKYYPLLIQKLLTFGWEPYSTAGETGKVLAFRLRIEL
jgi:hypothetical protein